MLEPLLKLLKSHRTIVHRARQPKAVLDKNLLSTFIACMHRSQLRNRYMRFIDEQQKITEYIE